MNNQLPLEVRFLKRYARKLHTAGVPAHQFERMMTALSDKLGFDCEVLSGPTAIFLSFHYQDDEDEQRPIPMQLLRMYPPAINLGNTAELYELGNELLDGQIDVAQANTDLRGWQPEQVYPLWLQIICWGLTGGAVAVMLSASWVGIAAAALTCALLGVLVTQAGAVLREGGLEAIAALLSTFVVFSINTLVPGLVSLAGADRSSFQFRRIVFCPQKRYSYCDGRRHHQLHGQSGRRGRRWCRIWCVIGFDDHSCAGKLVWSFI